MIKYFSPELVSDLLGVSLRTINTWIKSEKLIASSQRGFTREDLAHLDGLSFLLDDKIEPNVTQSVNLKSIELFSGAGGMALGLANAGFNHVLLNEIDKDACETLRANINGNIVNDAIENIDFTKWYRRVNLISGGVPCQPFSHNGNRLGFEDTRGTLFYQFARAIKEVEPDAFIMENVKGLATHDKGRTLKTMVSVLEDLGYNVEAPKVLNAFHYGIPQKRERLFIVGFREDLKIQFKWPAKNPDIKVVSDALCSGSLYPIDVPESIGQKYPKKAHGVFELIPEGGNWRDLPDAIKIEVMGASLFNGGGNSGTFKRLAMDRPSPTLTCSPAQKQTGRCHPIETRPLSVREYARIQSFPDHWDFKGTMGAQYRQIGNAVPPKLSEVLGESIVKAINSI
ncbi:DNA (cytosine-5-)-methyltransferase [Vibrio parahaemolyticus]|uniref:DNA (cytosine-5-)-methyltransferase n=2 Tax=Vibrio parahaemolyticus TaxID=670 RepID=UPI00235FFAF1|nr:DNA (cytosine-5-)-methyltransferase [Vibrio parahaemolyticus]